MRRPACFNCSHFVPTAADLGECHYEPARTGLKVKLIVLVQGEEVGALNAKLREAFHGGWPSIPPESPCCRFHDHFLKWKNTPDPLSVEPDDDCPI
jgi:hypothetical protein